MPPSKPMCSAYRCPGIPPGGFPHSDISGSSLVGSSPKLFAAIHVLHRPLAPRHPPCALCSLFDTPCKTYSVQFLRCKFFHGVSSLAAALGSHRPPGLCLALSPCGDEGTRTPGLLRAREALSHLSYIPPKWAFLDSNQRPLPYQRSALAG